MRVKEKNLNKVVRRIIVFDFTIKFHADIKVGEKDIDRLAMSLKQELKGEVVKSHIIGEKGNEAIFAPFPLPIFVVENDCSVSVINPKKAPGGVSIKYKELPDIEGFNEEQIRKDYNLL